MIEQIKLLLETDVFKFTLLLTFISTAIVTIIVNPAIILLCALAGYMLYVFRSKQQHIEAVNQGLQQQQLESQYFEILHFLYPFLKEYSFLGLHIPSENSIIHPGQKLKYYHNIAIFRYQIILSNFFQTDTEQLRKILNQRIAQEVFSQPLYILQLKQDDNKLILLAIYNDSPATSAFIARNEHSLALAATNVPVDSKDKDF